jgi:polyisoprenoid-binding protein YceI
LLTLRGVTKPLTVKTSFGGSAKDARGRERVAFSATTAIDREAFGLKWNQVLEAGGVALGGTVDLEIELQAINA